MLAKRVKRLDLFGTNINFTYRGDDYFTTGCGSGVTVFATIGFLFLASMKFIEFFGETDPIEYMTVAK